MNCTFDRNRASGKYSYSFDFTNEGQQPTFADCDFGNSSFNNKSLATFANDAHLGSLIGQGNISILLSLLAIFTAVTTFFVVVNKNKKLKVLFSGESNEADD